MKKWYYSTLTLMVSILIGIGFLNYNIDPYMQYKLKSNTFFYKADPILQMPGVVKNIQKSNLLIGGSGLESLELEFANTLFDTTFVKIAVPNSTSKLIYLLLEKYLKDYSPEYVIYFIRPENFCYARKIYTHDNKELPLYLYDSNIYNDYRYLLNIQVLKKSFEHLSFGKSLFNLSILYRNEKECNPNSIRREFDKQFKEPAVDYSSVCREWKLEKSIDEDIFSLIKQYRKTKFLLVNLPITNLKQEIFKKNNIYSNYQKFSPLVSSKVNSLSNAYYFNYRESVKFTKDLDKFCDLTHFSENLAKELLLQLKTDYFSLSSSKK